MDVKGESVAGWLPPWVDQNFICLSMPPVIIVFLAGLFVIISGYRSRDKAAMLVGVFVVFAPILLMLSHIFIFHIFR